jgi:predicted 3-demethylubiquinone-9 3-methyltransferase (glyoxalase superfamily)
MTQKITPFLWFDDNAEVAIDLYVSTFKNAEVVSVNRIGEGPDGSFITGTFKLAGLELMALNGGPQYTFTPAVSFFVQCQSEQEVDEIWPKLSEGGMALMPLDTYPFSEKFGWVQDRFGLSWQVSLANVPQSITPFLMFVGAQYGRAEEAINRYVAIFKDSGIDHIQRYGPARGEPEGTVMHVSFRLAGQPFMALDSGADHNFTFSEANSFFVSCETQDEVDYFWNELSAGGEPGQCGWLKDTFGVSWQVIPTALPRLLQSEDREKANRVMQAMLQMTKLDIAQLEQA